VYSPILGDFVESLLYIFVLWQIMKYKT